MIWGNGEIEVDVFDEGVEFYDLPPEGPLEIAEFDGEGASRLKDLRDAIAGKLGQGPDGQSASPKN